MLLGLIELNFNDSIPGRMHSECIRCILGRMRSECIQNAFSAAKTKNQDSPRTPEQILEFPNQNQEPRTKIPKDSWANLRS